MPRHKSTARKSKGGIAPRRQLTEAAKTARQAARSKNTEHTNQDETSETSTNPSQLDLPSSPKNNNKNNKKINKKLKAEKRKQKNEQLKIRKIQERRESQELYEVVYVAYIDLLGEGFEYDLPPALLRNGREVEGEEVNYVGKRGPKKTKRAKCLDDCGMCRKVFRDITKYKNHMPYHNRYGCYYCMFCWLNGRPVIECVFVTEQALIEHLRVYEFIQIGAMKKGKEASKPELQPKPENTEEWQKKLEFVMRLAYDLPVGITFQVSFRENNHGKVITGKKK